MTEDEVDEILRALSHPVRRWIFHRCDGSWIAAGAMTDELGFAAATVSEHLKVLRKAGLIELQTDGKWRRYQTTPKPWRQACEAVDKLLRPPT